MSVRPLVLAPVVCLDIMRAIEGRGFKGRGVGEKELNALREILLQATHRQGNARRAQGGAHRVVRLHRQRDSRSDSQGPVARAREAVDWFKQTLGADNFFLELQNHGIAEQAKVNRHLIKWAKDSGLKLVATNNVHYINKSDSHAHDCLICIGTQTQLADTKRMHYEPEQFFLRSAEEMKARFAETPEAIENTLEVAEKCNLEIEFGKLHYPVFTPPEHFTREGYLRKLVAEGLARRYGMHTRAEGTEFIVEKSRSHAAANV